jgi:NADP-dependent 3-hydroxy acid dehydrogenase YdfG
VARAIGGTAVVGDVTDADHVAEVVATAAALGQVELLVNNAG